MKWHYHNPRHIRKEMIIGIDFREVQPINNPRKPWNIYLNNNFIYLFMKYDNFSKSFDGKCLKGDEREIESFPSYIMISLRFLYLKI